MPELTSHQWDDFLSSFPNTHLLQTSAWGELKSHFGWQAVGLVTAGDPPSGAQVLFRRLPLGLSLAYIPKGPVGGAMDRGVLAWEALWPEIDELCRRRKVIFLKVEPDLWEKPGAPDGSSAVAAESIPGGFLLSVQAVQPPRTLLVDLRGEEQAVLARMKQKTRYNVRLALKKGIVVSASSDLETFHRLMLTTGQRDAFAVHSLEYYHLVYELFHPRGECELLVAEFEGEPVGALMAFAHGQRAWYFYGASVDRHRERMPTYLLQWEAMRWARSRGCTSYDLWGVPDVNEQTLETDFQERSGGLWGVYRFKRGFGGQLFRAPGPWDRVYSPALYALYRLLARAGD